MTKNISFDSVFKEYNLKIQNVISKFIPSSNCEDVKQEVYIKTWKNIDKYDSKRNMWGWINTITVNTCKDFLKLNKKHLYNLDIDEYSQVIPDKKEINEPNERQQVILNAVNKLKPKFKEVILLYDIEELSYEEISKKLNVPIGTIKSRLFNARQLLKQDLIELLKEDL